MTHVLPPSVQPLRCSECKLTTWRQVAAWRTHKESEWVHLNYTNVAFWKIHIAGALRPESESTLSSRTHTHTVAQDWMWEHCSGNSLMHTAAPHAEPDIENGLSRERQTRERGGGERECRTERAQEKMSRSMRLLLHQRSLSEHIRYSTCRALDLFNGNTRDQRLTGECVTGCGRGCGCANVDEVFKKKNMFLSTNMASLWC